MSAREPNLGRWYNVVCPSCYSTAQFECKSLRSYSTVCDTCKAVIDLRNPNDVLVGGDPGSYPEGSSEVVRYAKDVEESDGLSACMQVGIIINNMEEEKTKTMPTRMTGETTQAFSAQRNQALAEKFSFLYPITYALEYLVFGTKPDAKIGHVRIFRKRIPFYGFVNIPVPKTSTSYSAPTAITFTMMIGFCWFCSVINQDWSNRNRYIQYVLVFFFYTMMYKLVYTDPGYIRPGYLENEERLADELTLKAIEANQRESTWDTVNGVTMERKWCSTCEMYRPPRAAHCYLCGLCCYDHDHHCSVIGACVGRRKIEMFATFVTVTSASLIMPITTVSMGLYYHADLLTPNQTYMAYVVLFFLLVLGIPITMTAVSMWQSVVLEATTRERLQHAFQSKRNPYDRGYLSNIWYHLVQRKVAPSLFDDEFVRLCSQRYQKRELGTGRTVTCF